MKTMLDVYYQREVIDALHADTCLFADAEVGQGENVEEEMFFDVSTNPTAQKNLRNIAL